MKQLRHIFHIGIIRVLVFAIVSVGIMVIWRLSKETHCSASRTDGKRVVITFRSTPNDRQLKLVLSLAGITNSTMANETVLASSYDPAALDFVRQLPFVRSIESDSTICAF